MIEPFEFWPCPVDLDNTPSDDFAPVPAEVERPNGHPHAPALPAEFTPWA